MDQAHQLSLLPLMATFARVIETGSFSAAARQADTSASAISRQIARLEQALSLRLVERTTRQLRLTEAGAEILEQCHALLMAADAVHSISERFLTGPQGVVRLGVPKALGQRMIGPLLPAFLNEYPQVDVHLLLNDLPLDLIGDRLDLMIRITEQPPPGLAGRPLLQVSHVLCATPDYLATHGTPTTPQGLKQHSCLYLGESLGDHRWHLRQGDVLETVAVHGRLATNHSGVRLEAALQHLGIACLPAFTAAPALAEGLLVPVLEEWEYTGPYQGTAWLLYAPNRYLPAKVRVLIDFLAARLAR
ncbi:DNA-binding transcriptional LysR family regulator [Pseudomonas duriflava]|uniref:DNA-binding transcriptional LysR family regulator n=1 Tax=Pseudomonas duriflava TaxID=459528 RepID=A0A562Q6G3_9PSED|nr:LysR family transcriptional regulator [Pseudomonas duriflava]TWI52304.1 DNA-binding transcriptional LysR family regulator [Pseudomonas duriflava]